LNQIDASDTDNEVYPSISLEEMLDDLQIKDDPPQAKTTTTVTSNQMDTE
jgi:hypothetical protein